MLSGPFEAGMLGHLNDRGHMAWQLPERLLSSTLKHNLVIIRDTRLNDHLKLLRLFGQPLATTHRTRMLECLPHPAALVAFRLHLDIEPGRQLLQSIDLPSAATRLTRCRL